MYIVNICTVVIVYKLLIENRLDISSNKSNDKDYCDSNSEHTTDEHQTSNRHKVLLLNYSFAGDYKHDSIARVDSNKSSVSNEYRNPFVSQYCSHCWKNRENDKHNILKNNEMQSSKVPHLALSNQEGDASNC